MKPMRCALGRLLRKRFRRLSVGPHVTITLHFAFTDAQVAKWRSGEGVAMFEIDHPGSGHMALIGEDVRRELARDFARGFA